MYITLNEQNIIVNVTKVQDRLSLYLTYDSDNILELYEIFHPNNTPEIVLHDETNGGITSAIYANHRILAFHIMEHNNIQIDLQVDPIEISEAQRISETLQVQLQEMVENNAVINEILNMIANHEERLYALEPHPEADDGSGDDEE